MGLKICIETEPSTRLDYDEIQFEKQLGEGSFGIVYLGDYRGNKVALSRLSRCVDMPNDTIEAYWNLKRIRNMLVHGVEIPEDRDLLVYIDRIIELRKEIKSFFD